MFAVYSLSRSRSYWLSQFLTYGKYYCTHGLRVRAKSLDWFKGYLSAENIGVADPGLLELYHVMISNFPDHKQVVVHRPLEEINASFAKLGVDYKEPEYRLKLLKTIGSIPGVLNVTFEELKTLEGCKKVFEFCLDREFDYGWYDEMKDKNLQVDMPKTIELFLANQKQMARVDAEAGIIYGNV